MKIIKYDFLQGIPVFGPRPGQMDQGEMLLSISWTILDNIHLLTA